METETAVEQQNTPAKPRKAGSGYARLRNRHRALIEEHEALKAEHYELLAEQQQLQQDVDRLLAVHQRLMQSAKVPSQANWFESAHMVLNQIATQPDLRTTQVFAGALASLQQKLATIVSRLP